jgi:metal-dependent amidase/aminoacylase/carboxypeptidase family protein
LSGTDILDAVREQGGAVLETMHFVHEHPELAYEEFACCEHLVSRLEPHLEVERGLAGMPTGFRATLRGARSGPTVGVVAVYDAVAVPSDEGPLKGVHSCGHGPIAGAVVGTALALASIRSRLSGTFVVFGCPADETASPGTIAQGGGKTRSVEAGAWRGVDAALFTHPESHDGVFHRSRWFRRYEATYAGDHDPDSWALPSEKFRLERVAIERNGRTVTRVRLRVFGENEGMIVQRAGELAALHPPESLLPGRLTAGVRSDARVTATVASAFKELGRDFVADTPEMPFSNDFGTICQEVPAALIGISRPGGWAMHTDEGAEQFASAEGEALAQTMAAILALTSVRLLES